MFGLMISVKFKETYKFGVSGALGSEKHAVLVVIDSFGSQKSGVLGLPVVFKTRNLGFWVFMLIIGLS